MEQEQNRGYYCRNRYAGGTLCEKQCDECKHSTHPAINPEDDVTDEQIDEAMGDMSPEAMADWNKCCDYIVKHKMSPNLDAP